MKFRMSQDPSYATRINAFIKTHFLNERGHGGGAMTQRHSTPGELHGRLRSLDFSASIDSSVHPMSRHSNILNLMPATPGNIPITTTSTTLDDPFFQLPTIHKVDTQDKDKMANDLNPLRFGQERSSERLLRTPSSRTTEKLGAIGARPRGGMSHASDVEDAIEPISEQAGDSFEFMSEQITTENEDDASEKKN